MSPSKYVLQVDKLNMVLRPDVYVPSSLRDRFVNAITHPIDTFMKEKDRHYLIKDMSFKLKHGDRVGLLGVNGAGKTTLCRCISGVYGATSGQMNLQGEVRSIFEVSVGIQPELTGRENIEILSWILYPQDKERKQWLEEAMIFSELGAHLNKPVKTYSTGMLTRLCLSIVTCKPCDLLILDEVFEGADRFFSQKIAQRILRLIEDSGAVLFVSHDVEQVRRVCNRVILIDHGQIVFDGSVDEGLKMYCQRPQLSMSSL